SRRMALYSVCAGVLPPGLVQRFCSAIASIISLVVIAVLDSANTFAAALIALSFLVLAWPLAAGLDLGLLARAATRKRVPGFFVSSRSSWLRSASPVRWSALPLADVAFFGEAFLGVGFLVAAFL